MRIDCFSDINKVDETLRPYQEKAKREIFEAWDEVNSVMFQMPTGTGTAVKLGHNRLEFVRTSALQHLLAI